MEELILENPITKHVSDAVRNCESRMCFAVPFLSSFAEAIIKKNVVLNINDKRLISRFDDTSITTFDIPTFKYLMECGFEIRFLEKIHLKMYIFDESAYVTSSNLTKGGFENNIELTVKVDTGNVTNCIKIFDDLWLSANNNRITLQLLDDCMPKYEVLKKKEKFHGPSLKPLKSSKIIHDQIDSEFVLEELFHQQKDYSLTRQRAFEANKRREEFLKRLKLGFNTALFYVPEGQPNRRCNLFYDFAYGTEVVLAGTGIRERQFAKIFNNEVFEKVIEFLLPETVGLAPWNLENSEELYKFCNGIFDFNISEYKEVIPIRLASYFYPEKFLPIFNLEHLQIISEDFGRSIDVKTKGERFLAYNSYILEQMKSLPYDNYIKSDIAYQILYTFEYYQRWKRGEDHYTILSIYREVWKRNYLESGCNLLHKIGIID